MYCTVHVCRLHTIECLVKILLNSKNKTWGLYFSKALFEDLCLEGLTTGLYVHVEGNLHFQSD